MANSFTPQEIEQFLQEFFDTVGARQYTGARYVPIFGRKGSNTCEWDNYDAYEPLTIVIYRGNSYTSKQYVPKDIPITDTNYWVQTGNWNAQIEQYRQEVLQFQDEIDAKIPWPIAPESKYGSSGQVLGTLLNGLTKWVDPVIVTSEIAGPLISEWLSDHPEATTTVEDGAITYAKLNSSLQNALLMDRGLPAELTALADLTDVGTYRISTIYSPNDLPIDAIANSSSVLENLQFASSIVQQIYYNSRGQTFMRLVNTSTNQPITSNILNPDAHGWYLPRHFETLKAEVSSKYAFYGSAGSELTLLSTLHDLGVYIVPTPVPATDRPVNAIFNTSGMLEVTQFGNNLVRQTYANSRGQVFYRIVNTTTNVPILSNIVNADEYGWASDRQTEMLRNQCGRWRGKTIAFFGDSRTWYDGHPYNNSTKQEWRGRTCVGYQQQCKTILDCNVVNQGVSGDTSIQIAQRIEAYDFSGTDALFLEGGVNDWYHNVTIGTIAPIGSTFDTSTVYGALQHAIEYVLGNYPQTKIYIDVPPIAWVGGNVFPEAIAEVKKNIANLYNLPCLDLYHTAGINQINRGYYFVDDLSLTNQWYLHFNDYGNAMLGQIIAMFMMDC